MDFPNCNKTECSHNKDNRCKLGSEIDELIDDYFAEDIPKDCTYLSEIEAAAKEFEA